jgi:hypothetical protein
MFVLSPGGGLLNNLYTRRMIKHTFIFHTPTRSGLIKNLQLYGTNTNKTWCGGC